MGKVMTAVLLKAGRNIKIGELLDEEGNLTNWTKGKI